jgi:hypothetical protein
VHLQLAWRRDRDRRRSDQRDRAVTRLPSGPPVAELRALQNCVLPASTVSSVEVM